MKTRIIWSVALMALCCLLSGCVRAWIMDPFLKDSHKHKAPVTTAPSKAWFVENYMVITAGDRMRYNALISVYGKTFNPPLAMDYGVTSREDGYFLITKQALVWWGMMQDADRIKPAQK